ncbi:MAG: beta-phosphoglucomutase family hydrolase [Myxococcales bacterium]|nr:beta-phosphoglucomutase family hydrolase [Myxococcales bacterium]
MNKAADGLNFQAILFDLDGVLTATARVHEQAWKQTFDSFLEERSKRAKTACRPFTREDYLRYVDGRLREDGVRSFLGSRGIQLPDNEAACDHSAGEETVRSLADRKNRLVVSLIRPDTIDVYPGSVAVAQSLRIRGFKTAVVSASANCQAVLEATGIGGVFDTVVDGTVVAELGLRGKPAPDSFLEAARRLEVEPAHAIVVEDAVAGVRAGREGGFGLVIGIDRQDHAAALRRGGAHLVVGDLWELIPALLPEQHGPKIHRLLEVSRSLAIAESAATRHAWKLEVQRPAAELVPQLESVLALANGHLGIRGSTEEGSPAYRPATLLNGFHDTWPIDYAEDAYGFARVGQTILRAPDGSRIRLFVDDKELDPVRQELASYSRTLHLDRGVLERSLVWILPDGARIRVRSERVVSLVRRHLACMVFEVESLDRAAMVTLCSELGAPSQQHIQRDELDPRKRQRLDPGVVELGRELTDHGVLATYTTQNSGLVLACGVAHRVEASGVYETTVSEEPDVVRYVVSGRLEPGQRMRLEKLLAYHYSGRRTGDELRFRVQQTLDQAVGEGAAAVLAEHTEQVRAFWRDADIDLEGPAMLQFALRYSLFQLLQASARVEGHGIPAKGLTGEGYEGHYFWDTEIYVLPFLIYTRPRLARALLLRRYEMLHEARARAKELGQRGALFPWRTINGKEASASYASGTAQYHINADIVFALHKYVEMSGDQEFMREHGAEILVETARFWVDLGFFSARKQGMFVINGVTGPDEYTTVVDNNAYTNLMARENLRVAARVLRTLREEYPDEHDRLVARTHLGPDEEEGWQRAADAMYVPYDEEAQVHLQDDTFLDLKPWDFDGVPPEKYPLLLHFHPLNIYRHQVIKQADVMLAAFLLGNAFSEPEKRRIFDYYDPLTTGDSSLSECIQSIVACEVGEVAVAHRYLNNNAITDLADRHRNVRDGMHIASCGGTWMAVVYGFAGLRDYDGQVSFRPSLPPHWEKLRFRLRVRSTLLEVQLEPHAAVYRLLEGETLTLVHRDQRVSLARGEELRIADEQMVCRMWRPSSVPEGGD